jgi:hypothetical protein
MPEKRAAVTVSRELAKRRVCMESSEGDRRATVRFDREASNPGSSRRCRSYLL